MTLRYVLPVADDLHRETAVAALWGAGADGLWERPHEVVAYFDAAVDLTAGPAGGGRWEEEPDRDWLAEWKAGLEPVTVGRLTVAPSWTVSGPDAATVVIDPGMAFGTGHHATTRRCLAALDRLDLTGRSLLDVGTGSGVLAVAAARLGAVRVVAVDVDPEAVRVARENASRNGVEVDVRHGSVEAVPAERCDVTVANIATAAIVSLADALLAACGETLIVSGIAAERADQVTTVLGDRGARVTRVDEEDGWVAITADAVSGDAGSQPPLPT